MCYHHTPQVINFYNKGFGNMMMPAEEFYPALMGWKISMDGRIFM